MPVLVIKNDGIGDLVLASGLIAALARESGPVDLVTCVENREIAEWIPGLRQRLYVSRDSVRLARLPAKVGMRWYRGEEGDQEVVQRLHSTTYDRAVCLRRYIRQSTVTLMTVVKAAERHCAWQFPTNLTAREVERWTGGWNRYEGPPEVRSELEYYRGFLRQAVGLRGAGDPELDLPPGRPAPEPGLWGLSVGGSSTNWPAESWEALAGLATAAGKRLVLFGGRDASDLARGIKVRAPGALDLVGAVNFAGALQHLRRLEVLISNDTGFAHFASLAAARVLVILGGGTFLRFLPWPDHPGQRAVFSGMDCFDCEWQCKFASRQCLEAVTPDAVFHQATRWTTGESAPLRLVNLNPSTTAYQPGWRRLQKAGPACTIPGGGESGGQDGLAPLRPAATKN